MSSDDDASAISIAPNKQQEKKKQDYSFHGWRVYIDYIRRVAPPNVPFVGWARCSRGSRYLNLPIPSQTLGAPFLREIREEPALSLPKGWGIHFLGHGNETKWLGHPPSVSLGGVAHLTNRFFAPPHRQTF